MGHEGDVESRPANEGDYFRAVGPNRLSQFSAAAHCDSRTLPCFPPPRALSSRLFFDSTVVSRALQKYVINGYASDLAKLYRHKSWMREPVSFGLAELVGSLRSGRGSRPSGGAKKKKTTEGYVIDARTLKVVEDVAIPELLLRRPDGSWVDLDATADDDAEEVIADYGRIVPVRARERAHPLRLGQTSLFRCELRKCAGGIELVGPRVNEHHSRGGRGGSISVSVIPVDLAGGEADGVNVIV